MLKDCDVKVFEYTFEKDIIYLILTNSVDIGYKNFLYEGLCIGSEDNYRDDLVGETIYEIDMYDLSNSDFKMSDSKLYKIYNQINSSKLLNS